MIDSTTAPAVATAAFSDFGLDERIMRALRDENYEIPTPVQAAAIPLILTGADVMATAQTGTGKTAAFALPLLHLLATRKPSGPRMTRALILTPTRELAQQIDQNLRTYGRYMNVRTTVVVGGLSMGNQIRSLRMNPEIVVATPGRLLDLMEQGFVHLKGVELLALDEADRMLDMGFLPSVKQIAARMTGEKQTVMFSATLSSQIGALAASLLHDPQRVSVARPDAVALNIQQQVYFVEQGNKRALLSGILQERNIQKALVFTRTKHKADRVMEALESDGISAEVIHGNKSQNQRQRSLKAFDRGHVRVLVATDVVARGIDVDGISHVFNFELPNEPESYVHRIGRTARAGAEGVALSFCSADEVGFLKDIERLTKTPLDAEEEHLYHSGSTARLYKEQGMPRGSLPGFGRSSFGGTSRGPSYGGRPQGKSGFGGGNGYGRSDGRGDARSEGPGAGRKSLSRAQQNRFRGQR